ncbi:hypothetical protein DQ04_04351030 [Trypanosoma grayi]|uniref:hypothetical protein n=1 Tax=Trypanosoma grayi TaxID=71804 RepID=UPI0004F47F9A|nr:hypothetical protein DQ04_04351030 [Trypanosoma grayi]KEG09980.1 hypothetical protein DQ04_04351030 [Trypanosoma grayi]
MGGEEGDASKEVKETETAATHTFSVNAAPFEPGANTSSFIPEKWQEPPSVAQPQALAMGSSAPWAYSAPYYDMMLLTANMRAVAQMNALISTGIRRYSGTPIVRASSPTKRNMNTSEGAKGTDRGSLSIHAKPWSPTPESGLNQEEGDTYIQLEKGWIKVPYRGKMVVAPVAFKEMSSLFVHSLTVRPIEKPRIHLGLFNYLCARCATRSFFGRLSCRGADVILKGVAGDIPPLRIAHLIEQVTGDVVCALFTEGDHFEYELWLEKPENAAHLVSTVSGALWTCPMFHGYAVHTKTEDEKTFLREYIASLKEGFPEPTPYPMCCVEAIASTTANEKVK